MMLTQRVFRVVLLILLTAAPAFSEFVMSPLSSVPGIKIGHVTDEEAMTC
jgi:hypothetical protein